MKAVRFIGYIAAGSVLLFASPAQMRRPVVTATRSSTRIHIDLPDSVHVDLSWKPGDEKIVLYLRNVFYRLESDKVTQKEGPVEVVRVGNHAPDTWVALDLADPVSQPKVSRSGGLNIEVTATGNPVAHASRNPPPRKSSPGTRLRVAQGPGGSPRKETTLPPDITEPAPKPKSSGRAAQTQPSPVPIDETTISLAPDFALNILEDKAQDLRYVLQMYRGFFGFGAAESALHFLFQANESGEWVTTPITSGKESLNSYFALRFLDNRSALIRRLREENQIPSTLEAFALFPESFRDVITQQVRHAAAQQGRAGPLTAATIKFAMEDTSGIEVTSVK